jgi:hypothetical protein
MIAHRHARDGGAPSPFDALEPLSEPRIPAQNLVPVPTPTTTPLKEELWCSAPPFNVPAEVEKELRGIRMHVPDAGDPVCEVQAQVLINAGRKMGMHVARGRQDGPIKLTPNW